MTTFLMTITLTFKLLTMDGELIASLKPEVLAFESQQACESAARSKAEDVANKFKSGEVRLDTPFSYYTTPAVGIECSQQQ